MLKGRRDGLQVLKDGSVKLTISIAKEDLPEAVNLQNLFISADMPKQDIDTEEIRKRCVEALNKAIDSINEPQAELFIPAAPSMEEEGAE